MKIQNNTNKQNITFKGPLDGAITTALMTIDTNPMANAALVDTFAMVLPRTYVDSKKRNKYAGAETFFREATGTVIVCLSSGPIAKGIASIYNKLVDKEININPNLWLTNDSYDLLNQAWKQSDNKAHKYVKNVFSNISGIDGKKTNHWKDINWRGVEFYDDPSWENIQWQSPSLKGIQNRLKSGKEIIKITGDLIESKKTNKKDVQNVLKIIEHRIANALKVSSSINTKVDDKSLNSSLTNLVRDTYDLGKEIFIKTSNLTKAESKLKSMNKVKSLGAIGIAASLGLVNQFINRQITKKRTGSDDFVGEKDFGKKKDLKENKESKLKLNFNKLFASAGIFTLAMAVMKIKKPSEFVKKLEFTGPITSGNAIKTVYTATLIGRFLAAKNNTELRESATRDYLGFLNWLVFGGFVSKGVGQLFFDKKKESLFNITKEGTGIKHWLNNVTPKSHAEIAAKGSEFAKNNIWKLNVMHTAGLLYSGLALGFALPLLNIFVTNRKDKHNNQVSDTNLNFTSRNFNTSKSFEHFGTSK